MVLTSSLFVSYRWFFLSRPRFVLRTARTAVGQQDICFISRNVSCQMFHLSQTSRWRFTVLKHKALPSALLAGAAMFKTLGCEIFIISRFLYQAKPERWAVDTSDTDELAFACEWMSVCARRLENKAALWMKWYKRKRGDIETLEKSNTLERRCSSQTVANWPSFAHFTAALFIQRLVLSRLSPRKPRAWLAPWNQASASSFRSISSQTWSWPPHRFSLTPSWHLLKT